MCCLLRVIYSTTFKNYFGLGQLAHVALFAVYDGFFVEPEWHFVPVPY
jgi:hypothetical protein